MKSHFIHDNFKLAVFLLISHRLLAAQFCTPGWLGETLIDCQITAGWTVEHDNGSSGNLITTAGVDGGAVQLQWNLGSGSWVQARYLFSPAIDLSGNDIFGLSLHGQAGTSNRVSLMFADTHGVFYGIDCDGLNVIDRWMVNLSFPKKMFYHFFTISAGPPGLTDIDWRSIDRFFVVVKRPGNSDGGGNGRLGIDLLQADRAADWPRPRSFEAVTGNETAKMAALEYIQNSQTETGLLVSWKEEPVKKSYLYDQALALIALCREGTWQNGVAADEFAKTAEKLVGFIQSTQKHDGSWPRAWNSKTGENLVDDSWIGDQAWWVMALCIYARKSGDDVTMAAAQRGAEWLVQHVNNDGTVVPSTEGTVDTWWALVAAERFAYADKIQQALLTKHRDDELGYWYRGFAGNPDPVIAMDAATWMSAFARSSRVNLPQMGLEALGFVQRTLVTADDNQTLCGFDGMGPVSIWCEGTAQYVAAGGPDSDRYLQTLLQLQRPDGGMPGSPDDWSGSCFGWLSSWTGLSATAWLYFALTGMPFEYVLTDGVERKIFNQPSNYQQLANYPNPFNSGTVMTFHSGRKEPVRLEFYNITAEIVKSVVIAPGIGRFHWDGCDENGVPVAGGIYFCRLSGERGEATGKMILIR